MFAWTNWLRRLAGMNRRVRRATREGGVGRGVLVTFALPQIEALEERLAPATRVWTGVVSDLWSVAGNWSGNVAPQAEDNLVFPAGASTFVSTNDFGPDTRFRSITISDAAYQIHGTNRISLLEGFVYNAVSTSTGATFDVPITLGANQTFFSANVGAKVTLGDVELGNLQTLTIDGRGDLAVQGQVTGTGGITKLGDGPLILAGDNSLAGIVNVHQGIINLRHDNALGSPDAGTIAGLGAVIQVQDGVTVPENFVVRDVGVGFDMATLGAIRSVGGDNVLTGTVAMTNHGSFGVDA